MRRLRHWSWKHPHWFVRGSNVGGCTASAVEEASTVCDSAGLSSGVVGRNVCVGGVGGGGGDNVYECVFRGVDAG